MNVAAAVAGRKEACGRGADGVAGCRETGKGPCFLPATPQDQFIACSRDDSIHVPVHVPQPSGVRGLAAANALPGPPITSLMHASACHRTRMHAPARTAEPVCSQSWAMKSRSLPRALKFPGKTAKVTISTKMFAKTLQEQKLGYKIPVPRYNTRSLPRLCNSPSKIVQDSPIVHDINLLDVQVLIGSFYLLNYLLLFCTSSTVVCRARNTAVTGSRATRARQATHTQQATTCLPISSSCTT